jgi:hypothetical protein
MVHVGLIHKLVDTNNKEFSISFVSKEGELIKIKKCVCTSFYSSGRTMNIKILPSNQVITIRRASIVEFNGEEVFL